MSQPRVFVFFSPHGNGLLSSFLHPSYKHCFIAVALTHQWIFFDPLRKGVRVATIKSFNEPRLLRHFTGLGCRICEVDRERPAPDVNVFNIGCVALCRKILSIGGRLTFTPYQLYTWLHTNRRIRAEWQNG